MKLCLQDPSSSIQVALALLIHTSIPDASSNLLIPLLHMSTEPANFLAQYSMRIPHLAVLKTYVAQEEESFRWVPLLRHKQGRK
jgi:hypothetical protein